MRILVPVDGSAPAARALDHAISLLCGRAGSEIILVNVQGPETIDVSDFAAVVSAESDRQLAAQRSKDALRKAIARCRKAQLRFEARAEIGPVAETIAELARRLEVDQIVMGTRGLGAFRRLLLGSVATRVTSLVSIPVTLVK